MNHLFRIISGATVFGCMLLVQNGFAIDLTFTDPTGFTTVLTKVADLPAASPSNPGSNPRLSRSGILQIGDQLWFTTSAGGNYPEMGSITTYNLTSGQIQVQYSFGLPNPSDPTSARKDGYMPYATPVLGQGMYEGQIIYSTRFGGADWFNTGQPQSNNGGAVGVYNPATGQSTVLWSGDNGQNAANPLPSQIYSSPVYVSNASGQYLYFLTNQGGDIAAAGTTPQGSVVKLDLSNNSSSIISSFVLPANYTGAPGTMPGRLPQGGILQVQEKLYFASTNNNVLQVLDTVTDTVVSYSGPAGKTAGIFGTPIYDSERDAIYAVSLNQGIYKWDIETGMSTALPNSTGLGTSQSSGILFGDSIFYLTLGGSETTASYLYRYDLVNEQIYMLYNLGTIPESGFTSMQSGVFSIVNEDGQDVLYFITAGGGVNGAGTIMKLDVLPVPEPGSLGFIMAGAGVLACLRSRKRRAE